MIVHPDFQRRGIGDIQRFSARGKAGSYRWHGFVPGPAVPPEVVEP